MKAEPQKEHEWLHRMIGDWTFEAEGFIDPDQPVHKSGGTEKVRSLGGLWMVAEGQGAMPDGTPANTILTLGYDSQKGQFVGTWIGSMMTHMWVYEGKLDDSGKRLELDTTGPSMTPDGGTAQYREMIEFVSDDHRTFKSHVLRDNGEWFCFMTANYRRRG